MDKSERIQPVFFLTLFLLIHTLCWTLGPYWARPSLPHDTLESITWGLQWQLGYAKHPFLTAWVCAALFKFVPTDWSIYLLAQLLITATFLAVWNIAKLFLTSSQALIAVLTLEGVLFYNINSFNLTPDTMQSPLWAWLIFFFYRALTTDKIHCWLLTALFAALSFSTKYQAIIIFIPMLLFCFFNDTARTHFKRSGIYLGMVLFILLCLPHLIWLWQHEFISLTYVKDLSSEYTPHKNHWNYLYYPLLLLGSALSTTLATILLSWPFYKSKNPEPTLSSFQWQFLIYMGFGPLLITLAFSSVSGDYVPTRWLTPYFFLLSIITIGYLNPWLNKTNLKRFTLSFAVFSFLLFLSRTIVLVHFTRETNDAFIPNKTIAITLSNLWQKQYDNSLPYLCGSNYLVASVIPYISGKPIPYLNWQPSDNTWLNESDLRKKGALFIWDKDYSFAWDKVSREHTRLTDAIQGRFPELIILPNITFYKISNRAPFEIGVALLPPLKELT